MTKPLKDLEVLDSQLASIENKFKKKLEGYYIKLEEYTLRQAYSYKRTGEINIPESLEKGLENLFKNYFRDVERISTGYTKRELSNFASTPEEFETILNMKPEKSNRENLRWAAELAKKQVAAFIRDIKKILQETYYSVAKEFKDLVRKASLIFRKKRIKSTSETEASKTNSKTRLDLIQKSGLDLNIKLIVTLDARTTEHICEPRAGIIVSIPDFIRLRQELEAPLHVCCRTYNELTKEKAWPIKIVEDIITKYPAFGPIKLKQSSGSGNNQNTSLDPRRKDAFPEFENIQDSLKYHAKRILQETNNKSESLIVLGPTGEFLFQLNGTESHLDITNKQWEFIKKYDARIFHNHPDNSFPSPSDLIAFFNKDLPEMRVVVDNFYKTGKPAMLIFEGINPSHEDQFLKEYSAFAQKYNDNVRSSADIIYENYKKKNGINPSEEQEEIDKAKIRSQIAKNTASKESYEFFENYSSNNPESGVKYRWEDL